MSRRIFRLLLNALPFKKYLFGLLRLTSLPEPIFRHLYFKGLFKVACGQSHFVMHHYGYQLENNVFWRGLAGWEPTSMRLWIALCQEAQCILDIGANTGLYSLVAKTVNPHCIIHCFEPVLRVFEKLNTNIRANQYDIISHGVGVSNASGLATIYDLPSEHIYSVTINKNLNSPNQEVIPTTVPVTSLDDFAREQELRKIDLIKIDVETHEPEVLEGARIILQSHRPAILIEILNDVVASQIMALMKDHHYVYLVMDEGQGPRLVQELKPHGHTNYLLFPESSVVALLDRYEKTKAY